MNGWLDWVKVVAIVAPIVGVGYVAHYRIGVAEAAITDQGTTARENRERIIVLEQDRKAIADSLAEIKRDLREIGNSLKTRH